MAADSTHITGGSHRRQHHQTQVPHTILTEAQHTRIITLEKQIAECVLPKNPLTAYQIFENKNFNEVKQKWPHMTKREITDQISRMWNQKLKQAEREEFEGLAEQSQ